jgi:VWFA-related protein
MGVTVPRTAGLALISVLVIGLLPTGPAPAAPVGEGTTPGDPVATGGLRFRHEELVESTPLEHVELLVSVTGKDGLPVTGLAGAAFQVRERGEPVAILAVTPLAGRMDLPLTVALLVDRSGSMRIHMSKITRAAADLLSVMRPVDRVRLAAFSDELVILQDFTGDAASLGDSLGRAGPPAGGTRLFRAISETVRDLRGRAGRKAILVLTDGLDTDFTSPSSPVTVNMTAALTALARQASRAGVTVIVILPGPTGRAYLAVQDLALQTGGWYAYPGDDFAVMMRRLGERLLAAYVLEYDVDRPKDPDKKRSLEVRLRSPLHRDYEVRASPGTYAGLGLADTLAQDLREGSPSQRARAVGELARIPGPENLALLRDALRDRDPGVRVAAISALSELGDSASMKKIRRRLRDTDPAVKAAAALALSRETGREAPEGD